MSVFDLRSSGVLVVATACALSVGLWLNHADGRGQAHGEPVVAPVAPAAASAPDEGRKPNRPGQVVRAADGHYWAEAVIDDRAVRVLVDTGATMVSLGMGEAIKLGIDYSKGRPVRIGTANGVAQGWQLKLASVSIADVELRNVDAIINSSDMPYVLLGNSYLNSFHMSRIGSQLTLDRAK